MEKALHLLLSLLTIVFIVFLIAGIRFMFLYLKSGQIYLKRSPNPSIIDKMLFYERNPFTWRIGFAYSLLGYSQEQMDEFNKALYQVITAEKKMFSKTKVGRFRFLIKRIIQGKSSFSQIERYSTALTSHAVLNELDPKESLDYIMFIEMDKFLNSTVQRIKREQNNIPPERPPF